MARPSKLTEEDKAQILTMLKAGIRRELVALEKGVALRTIDYVAAKARELEGSADQKTEAESASTDPPCATDDEFGEGHSTSRGEAGPISASA